MGYLYSDIKVNNSSTAFPPSFPNFTFPQWYQVIQAQNLILFCLPYQINPTHFLCYYYHCFYFFHSTLNVGLIILATAFQFVQIPLIFLCIILYMAP